MPDTLAHSQASDPHTPTANPLISTPSLGSPDTPAAGDATIQTPGSVSGNKARPARVGIGVAAGLGKEKAAADSERARGGFMPSQMEGVGLGYGSMGESPRVGASLGPVLAQGIEGKQAPEKHVEDINVQEPLQPMEFPNTEKLAGMKRRLEEIEGGASGSSSIASGKEELVGMVRSLLSPSMDSLPFLLEQLEAQRDTIRTLQQQAKLSAQLNAAERERQTVERSSWQATIGALMRQRESEIAAGVRPNRLLDLNVGYHQELEAANKRLEMDNRLMAPRLADTQRQIDKLVTELKHLRPHVVLSSDPFTIVDDREDAPVMPLIPHPPLLAGQLLPQRPPGEVPIDPSLLDAPQSSARANAPVKTTRSRSPAKSGRTATMGDARTEHLLLAARKVRTMRLKDERVGRLTLEELKKGGVVGPDGGLGYSEGYGGFLGDDIEEVDDEEDTDIDEKPVIFDRRHSLSGPNGSGKGKFKPTTPGPSKSTRKIPATVAGPARRPPQTPITGSKSRGIPQTTPGGSNFNDLLRAAEMATRPGTPNASSTAQVPMSATSATRSTTRTTRNAARGGGEMDEDEAGLNGSPTKKARKEGDTWVRSRALGSMSGATNAGSRPGGSGGEVLLGLEGDGVDEQGGSSGGTTAFDLLFQASQIDSPSGSQEAEDPSSQDTGSPTARKTARASQAGLGLAPALEIRQSPLPPIREDRVGDSNIDPSLQDAARGSSPSPLPAGQSGQSYLGEPEVSTTAAALAQVPGLSTPALPAGAMATPKSRGRNASISSLTDLDPAIAGGVPKEMQTPARTWSAAYQESPFGGYDETPRNTSRRADSVAATPLNSIGGGYGSQSVPTTLAHGPAGTSLSAFAGGGPGGERVKLEGGGEYNSPLGGTVPGLGKYVHLTSSMPARRVRSPYLKWTLEEDELLARAVAIHGEKWDLVSKGVPTRSYHQVRQRWLRKTGAFDRKTGAAELGAAMNAGLGGSASGAGGAGTGGPGVGARGQDTATSPTPAGGNGRKRKMSLV